MKEIALPRLLYAADVPVEATYHGSVLIYRLLQDYPAEKLLVLEPTTVKSSDKRRLPQVEYRRFSLGRERLLRSRWATWYRVWLIIRAKYSSPSLASFAKDFDPQAVLTVVHGFAWLAAAAYARRKSLPLYVIVHDDWPSVINVPLFGSERVRRYFGDVLRQAKITFCVSPSMLRQYEADYSATCRLLYPSQGNHISHIPGARPATSRGLTVVFAGTINSDGYARILRSVGEAVERVQGKLVIFGPHTRESLNYWRLVSPAIENRGLIEANQLSDVLATEGDVMLVPMSFSGGEKSNMTMGFPSKIAEYCSTGVPMLIVGPRYCSAICWANSYAPVAEVLDEENPESILSALSRLRSAEHRTFLGMRARDIGRKLFSREAVNAVFHDVIGQR